MDYNYSRCYTYDEFGNRIQKTDEGTTISYQYNLLNQMIGETVKPNKGEKIQTRYEYDQRGNLKRETQNGVGEKRYEFDSVGMLVKVEDDETITTYQYDGLGNRIQNSVSENGETVKDVTYVVDSMSEYGDIIMTKDSTEQKECSYIYGNGLLSLRDQESNQYYQLDSKYSVKELTNLSGKTLTKVEYDEFGKIRNPETDSEHRNVFSYTGHVYDESIGLYYAKARYYDSEQGRMISEDPIKDGINWYTYCYNNPITYVDPSGYVTTKEGIAAHKQIEGFYEFWTKNEGKFYYFKANLELRIPKGISSLTGVGYADIAS